MNAFEQAFVCDDVEEFLSLIFPPDWGGVAARILESGVEFEPAGCAWAPRWSKIPHTVRQGETDFETAVKSCLFRAHDCLHQLWGLPIPGEDFSEDDRHLFKRAGMCGEVATLVIEEFAYCSWVYDNFPEARPVIWRRQAVKLWREGALRGKSLLQVAMRVDTVLHKKLRPKWVRESPEAMTFADWYVPMLEDDRRALDLHWEALRRASWRPGDAPNSRYNRGLDGLELTIWMIEDFFHLMGTDDRVDRSLRDLNCRRRETIVLPEGWDG